MDDTAYILGILNILLYIGLAILVIKFIILKIPGIKQVRHVPKKGKK